MLWDRLQSFLWKMQFKCSWLGRVTISCLAEQMEDSAGDGLRSHLNYFLSLFCCSSRNT